MAASGWASSYAVQTWTPLHLRPTEVSLIRCFVSKHLWAMTRTNVTARGDGFIALAYYSAYDFKGRGMNIWCQYPLLLCCEANIYRFPGTIFACRHPTSRGGKKTTGVVHYCAQVANRSVGHFPSAPHYSGRWNHETSDQLPPSPKKQVISATTVRRNRTKRRNAFFVYQPHQLHRRIVGGLSNRFSFSLSNVF
jgi:hypothetical protein